MQFVSGYGFESRKYRKRNASETYVWCHNFEIKYRHNNRKLKSSSFLIVVLFILSAKVLVWGEYIIVFTFSIIYWQFI